MGRPHERKGHRPACSGSQRLAAGVPSGVAAQLVRSNLISQARFVWRATRSAKKPGNLFGNPRPRRPRAGPSTGAATGELLSRRGRAGPRRQRLRWPRDHQNNRLRVLRPDWVTIAASIQPEPEEGPLHRSTVRSSGTSTPQGGGPARRRSPASCSPRTPSTGRRSLTRWPPTGLSWLSPVLREMQADSSATEHKIKFFENAGTPNMVFTLDKDLQPDAVARSRASSTSSRSALRTPTGNFSFLGGGADVTVVRTDLKQLDFSNVQGAGRNRISVTCHKSLPRSWVWSGRAPRLRSTPAISARPATVLHRTRGSTRHSPTCAPHLRSSFPVPESAELWYDPDTSRSSAKT